MKVNHQFEISDETRSLLADRMDGKESSRLATRKDIRALLDGWWDGLLTRLECPETEPDSAPPPQTHTDAPQVDADREQLVCLQSRSGGPCVGTVLGERENTADRRQQIEAHFVERGLVKPRSWHDCTGDLAARAFLKKWRRMGQAPK